MALMENAAQKLLTVQPGFDLGVLRQQTADIRLAQEKRRLKLEEHKASIVTAMAGSFLFDTATGAATTYLADLEYAYGEDFDAGKALAEDSKGQQKWTPSEQKVLLGARNQYHFDALKQRLSYKREWELNKEDLGAIPSLILSMPAEAMNIPNYLCFGLNKLKKANMLRKAVIAGLQGAAINVADRAVIDSTLHNQTATDYVVAGFMGLGLGWLNLVGTKGDPKVAAHIDDVANKGIRRQMEEAAYDFNAGSFPKGEGTSAPLKGTVSERAFKDASERVLKEGAEEAGDGFQSGTVGAGKVAGVYETLDPVYGKDLKSPEADSDSAIMQGAYEQLLHGELPQAEKLPHEPFGLASLTQSTQTSPNPLVRLMGKLLFEYPEGGGFKGFTAALEASKNYLFFHTGYAREYINLKKEYNAYAKSLGLKQTFDEAATLWIQDAKNIESTDPNITKIMEAFKKHYTKWNEYTHNLLKESGTDIAKDGDLDSKHIFRMWDAKAVHAMRNKYNSDVVIETFEGAIRQGEGFVEAIKRTTKAFEEGVLKEHTQGLKEIQKDLNALKKKLSKMDNQSSPEGLRLARDIELKYRELLEKKKAAPVYEAPDIDKEIKMIAKAFYNRFLRRATVHTAGGNLFSPANRGLLKDIINDVPMDKAYKEHINAVIDTMDRDQKANPFKHRTSMDLSFTHPKGLRLLDMMHSDLGSAYASIQRYWIGRAAGAKKGFPSEEAFEEALNQVDKHGSDRHMDAKDITADIDRLKAGWKLVKGEPVEDMDSAGATIMRTIRKLSACSMLWKLGFAQSAETGRVMAASGVKNIMDGIPFIRDMIMDLKDGRLDTPMLEEFQELLTGKVGNEHYMQHPDFRVDDFGHAISKGEKFIDKLSYWQSAASGWRVVYEQQRKILFNHLGKRFYNWFANDMITDAQMNDLGVSLKHKMNIKASMLKYAQFDENGALKTLGLDHWDPDTREAIALMLHRKTNNAILDIMAGETPLWMNTGLGKFLSQFKSFSVASLGKQTVHDLRMFKQGDQEAALAMQFSLASSMLSYIARTGYGAVARPSNERREYLERRLTVQAITAGVLKYHGSLGPLFDIADLLSSTVAPDTWGRLTGSQYRQQDVLNKIPGLSYVNTLHKGLQGLGKAITPSSKVSNSDWNAIMASLPFSAWYGFEVLNRNILKPTFMDNQNLMNLQKTK